MEGALSPHHESLAKEIPEHQKALKFLYLNPSFSWSTSPLMGACRWAAAMADAGVWPGASNFGRRELGEGGLGLGAASESGSGRVKRFLYSDKLSGDKYFATNRNLVKLRHARIVQI